MIEAALFALLTLPAPARFAPDPLPICGLHLSAPSPADVGLCADFIRDALPKEGVNTLVLEFDYQFKFKSHPEVEEPGALSREDVAKLVAACKDAHVRLIPQVNCLGHQSWAESTSALLRAHPEFDETPGKFPKNKGLYCRSYCPLHPGVHQVVFDVLDEIADACEATAVHCGMDEVMTLGDPDCVRCKGKRTADLFAGEVNALHDHLKSKGREMWMWGDRFIDGKASGIGDWEASGNDTAPAIDMVPKDIVICDWHYDNAEPTAGYFAMHGLRVVSSPWRKSEVALEQVKQIRAIRADANEQLRPRAYGMLHTTWCGCKAFIDAYYGKGGSASATETAKCFKDMYAAIRG